MFCCALSLTLCLLLFSYFALFKKTIKNWASPSTSAVTAAPRVCVVVWPAYRAISSLHPPENSPLRLRTHQTNRLPTTSCVCADELIVEKLRYAEIGDDLDFAFVDLIPGIDPIWTERRPKPKTPPPPPKLPTPPPPPPAPKEEAAAAAGGEGEAAAAGGEGAPAGPTKARTPSPFELRKHFPPEAAEVPYVRSSTGTTPKSSPAKEVAPAEAAPAPEAAAPVEAPAEGGADAAAQPAEAAAPAAEGEAPAAPAAEGEAAAPAPEAAAAPAEEAAPPAAEPAPEAPAS